MSRIGLVASLLATACGAELQPVIEAPPTRTVSFESVGDESGRVRLSLGTSAVVACSDSCSGACEGVTVESDHPRILSVRRVSPTPTTALHADGSTLFAITAHMQRSTTLTLRSECGNRRYDVSVVP